MTEVKAIAHADVKGKILLYVKIKTEVGEALIQVGEKNYELVKKITEVEKEKSEPKTK